MEASTLQPPASLAQPRLALGAPLLRLRSDEQLVALFRAGHDEAFRAIHDRYHKRLFAYARQMLPARQDAEDALQDVFVRAYAGLRASDRDLALRAWLFRVAHNRCVDELRKPAPPSPEVLQLVRTNFHDPVAEVDLRESLRRLVEDIRRLPEQQRSALLMRELAGMSYTELADTLGVSVGAVKSLLVRARMGLAQAAAARDTACALIREQLVDAHDHGMRPNANTRRHVRDCSGCKSFRRDLRGVSRHLAAMTPTIGPLGFLAKLLGISGGGGAAGGAGGGAALLGGGGTTASAGGLALSTGHVATLLVAAVATAGGAVEIQHTILPVAAKHTAHVRRHPGIRHRPPAPVATPTSEPAVQTSASVPPAAIGTDPRSAFARSVSSGPTTAKRSQTTEAAPDRAAGSGAAAGTTVAKRHARSGSANTVTTGTATTGAAGTATCTPAATSAPATTGSSSSASTSSSDPAGSASPGAASTAASPTGGASCDSVTGSSTSTSAPSSTGSSGGASSTTGTASTTGDGSGSSATASPGPDAGSSQSSSNVATG